MTRGAMGAALAAGVGAVLAAGFVAVGLLRRDRPLHPRGDQWHGVVRVHGPRRQGVRRRGADAVAHLRIGSPLLDHRGSHRAEIRRSRAASWPLPLDIPGLAVRVSQRGAPPADILFAGTGASLLGRWLLRPARRTDSGPLTTLLPMRSPTGRVWLRADPVANADPLEGRAWRLSVAVGRTPWREWATLVGRRRHDGVLRFDPVTHNPPGLEWPAWAAAVRAPAYRWAQRLVAVRDG